MTWLDISQQQTSISLIITRKMFPTVHPLLSPTALPSWFSFNCKCLRYINLQQVRGVQHRYVAMFRNSLLEITNYIYLFHWTLRQGRFIYACREYQWKLKENSRHICTFKRYKTDEAQCTAQFRPTESHVSWIISNRGQEERPEDKGCYRSKLNTQF